MAVGVTYALVRHGEPAARKSLPPVVITGVLRDGAGDPVANAQVQLQAEDEANPMKSIPLVQLETATTDGAGRFTIRQSPSVPIIRTIAAHNGGFVNFMLDITADGHFMPWGIPRDIRHHGWFSGGTPAASKQERITFQALG